MKKGNDHRVICFGEVLWDILPTVAVPGGAPMNVAYHLHKQNKNPAPITRAGLDENGKQLVAIFSGYGICTDYYQWDEEHETGKVFAQPGEHNEVIYDIVMPSAWDFIEWNDEYNGLVSNADHFVYGSLAARSEESKKTLLRLLEAATNKVLDINLRPPHYNRQGLEDLLGKANLLKLNLAELELISGWNYPFTRIDDNIRSVADRFNISKVVVTMGSNGACLYSDGTIYKHPGFSVKVKDTIGSGDAFLAGLLSKLMEDKKPEEALEFANGLGAFIATHTGACPPYETRDVLRLIERSNAKTEHN